MSGHHGAWSLEPPFIPACLPAGTSWAKGRHGRRWPAGPPGSQGEELDVICSGTAASVNPEGQSCSTQVTTLWEGGGPGRSHGLLEVWDRF